MTGTAAKGTGRLAELDLLRFLAAAGVVSFHYLIAFASVWGERPAKLFPETATPAGLGILGVELFFMISGFVILMSVWGRGLGAFALSRLVRLFPAYWISVGVVAAVYGLGAATALDPKLGLRDYLVNLTMFQRAFGLTDANGVYWSLWAELRFYLLISILVIVGVTFTRCLVFMGVWLLAAGIFTGNENEWVQLIVMPKYAAYFVGGMAFFLMTKHGPRPVLWCVAGLSGGLAVYAALARVEGRIDAVGYAAMPVPGWTVVVTVVIFYVLMALVALGALGWLRWRGLVVLGALTYPLYLFHSTVAAVLVPVLRDTLAPWLTVAVTVLVTLVLSYLVHRLVERPIQEFVKARRRRAAVPQGRHGRGPGGGAVPAPGASGENASEKASVP
ncbi:acyltransferase family protein [Streptosporangium jomthongense]|uniref:Acyltransferase family protein n=1 Tax=Streptosporangium jomthongense TaxID=1193683 RepID=A0ABV8F0C9_9ACTN